jgi:hypothetical protein
MSKSEARKAAFNLMEKMFTEATSQGAEAVSEHLMASAYGLGAQIAISSKPELVPELFNTLVTEMGRGIQMGMMAKHGMVGTVRVRTESVVVERKQ